MILRPWKSDLPEGAGCDLPGGMRPLKVTHEEKPEKGYHWWSKADLLDWLRDEWADARTPCKIEGPETDIRTHLEVDAQKGAAQEGMLFTTQMVAFERHTHRQKGDVEAGKVEWSLLCRVEINDAAASLDGPGPLGGENRLASIEELACIKWPTCPDELKKKLAGAPRVRMILATPAIFGRGWMPQWLDKTTKEGAPPGLQGKIRLKLVSAAVPRHQAVSGWEMENRRPKPVRWMAPAGSVYFFEVMEDGDAAILAEEGWLAPVSDDEETSEPHRPVSKNRDDGFGLALWGVWNGKEDNQ
jgi:CRISPR-associated protein Cmr3